MIIDEIKKQNVIAMKEKNVNARNIYSILMNKYLLLSIEYRSMQKEITDTEMIKIIQKTIKELIEEKDNYLKVGNINEANNIDSQKSVIEKYLPKMLSVDEILTIIETLEDKTIPSVMKFFRTNYLNKVNMSDVSLALKQI